jgi:hypothetical protein
MSTHKVKFPDYYDALAAFEIESKGFLDDVVVEFDDGRRYVLAFRDSWNVQLDHDATATMESGARVLGIPNVIIVDVVSKKNVLGAISVLEASGFFNRLGRSE